MSAIQRRSDKVLAAQVKAENAADQVNAHYRQTAVKRLDQLQADKRRLYTELTEGPKGDTDMEDQYLEVCRDITLLSNAVGVSDILKMNAADLS